MTHQREHERGLSMLEAIIITTITALLALLVIPLLPRSATSALAAAQQAVGGIETLTAERDFRALIRATPTRRVDGRIETGLQGDQSSLTLRAVLAVPVSCARVGAPVVRLRIEGDALFCESDGQARILARWSPDAVAALSYSIDGVTWLAETTTSSSSPYVRFEVRQGGRSSVTWVERALGAAR
jgi:hypothetical protein